MNDQTAILSVKGVGTMNKKDRCKIASWLRRQAKLIENNGDKTGTMTEGLYRARMRFIALAALCLLVSACSAVTVVDQIGNEYAQHSYSRNYWWPNYDRVVFCWKLDEQGLCPKEDTRVETITATGLKASGQAAAEQAVGSLPLAAGLGFGLAYSGSKTSNSQNATASQSVNQQAGPWRHGYHR